MKLSQKSVNWAQKHIQNFYDSDFYIKPFEFKGLWANWADVLEYLTTTEVNDFNVKQPIFFPAPKSKNGFRIVHQLDPLDSLIYTSLAYEVAEYVEKKRVNRDDNVACSYRIKINEDGDFFSEGTGYGEFKLKSLKLAETYDYVLVTDITDFYNQIYHHRLQNALEICDKEFKEISKNIEEFLMKLTTKVSRGVPVGPAASIIMAEALFNDIDEYILQREINYVRYVDDIRIFSDSQERLENILHDLTNYLYKSHRLTLSSLKTKIITCDQFISQYIDNHKQLEREAFRKALIDLDIKVDSEYPSLEPIDGIESLPDESKIKAQGQSFQNLMTQLLDYETIDLGLARKILRRCKQLRTRAILKQLLENFDFFTPAIRDVILYLEEVTNDKMIDFNIIKFENIVMNSKTIRFPFISYWLSNYFAKYKAFSKYPFIKSFIASSNLRSNAIFARTNESISWVREHKDTIDNVGPWERRAIIYSAQILSKDERDKWMNSLLDRTDLVDRSLASYIKSTS